MGHLRVFVVEQGAVKPRPGIPLVLSVRTNRGSQALALLASDHVGYASFDLSPYDAILGSTHSGPGETSSRQVHVTGLELMPLNYPALAIDVLDHYRLLRGEAPVLLEAPAGGEGNGDCSCETSQYPSLQNPTPKDWRVSPRSFARGPLLGQEGSCETLRLSDASVRDYTIRQIVPSEEVRLPRVTTRRPPRLRRFVEPMALHEFGVQWIPQGHALGEILYSLPLAPCESVRLAVVDWRREDSARKGQVTAFQASLQHSLRRDRAVDEAMASSLRELQSGTTVSASASVGFAGFGASFGVASNHQEGERDLAAEASQSIVDAVSQGGTAVRNLTSSVVVEASQAERDAIQTRVVTNHNHCHTLTVQYYEVLRHFLVQSRWIRRVDVATVPADLRLNWTAELALQFRHVLRGALLDRELEGALDALDIYVANTAEDPVLPEPVDVPAVDGRILRLDVSFSIDASFLPKVAEIALEGDADGAAYELSWPIELQGEEQELVPTNLVSVNERQEHELIPSTATVTEGAPSLTLDELRQVAVVIPAPGSWLNRDGVNLRALDVVATTPSGEYLVVHAPFHKVASPTAFDAVTQPLRLEEEARGLGSEETGTEPKGTPVAAAYRRAAQLVEQLVAHLARHRRHYESALLAAGDPHAIESLLTAAGLTGRVLPKPIPLAQGRVAFPLMTQRAQPELGSVAHERIVSLPTKGVFAESMLGHCSSCETRDVTRFWDWQESPCPERAPEIAPIAAGSRYQRPDLSATDLPSGVLNIVNPPAAPPPSGLGEAVKSLGAGTLTDTSSGALQSATTAANVAMTRMSPRSLADVRSLINSSDLPTETKEELTKKAIEAAIGASGDDATQLASGVKLESSFQVLTPLMMKDLMAQNTGRPVTRKAFLEANLLARALIYYKNNRSGLKDTPLGDGVSTVDEVGKFAVSYGHSVTVLFFGAASGEGDPAKNAYLSLDRAKGAQEHLVKATAGEPNPPKAYYLGLGPMNQDPSIHREHWRQVQVAVFHHSPDKVLDAYEAYLDGLKKPVPETNLIETSMRALNVRLLKHVLAELGNIQIDGYAVNQAWLAHPKTEKDTQARVAATNGTLYTVGAYIDDVEREVFESWTGGKILPGFEMPLVFNATIDKVLSRLKQLREVLAQKAIDELQRARDDSSKQSLSDEERAVQRWVFQEAESDLRSYMKQSPFPVPPAPVFAKPEPI